jgi:hypothetical protein
MAFLIIAGTTYEVLTDGASRDQGQRVGETERAQDGTLRSTVRATKRLWRMRLGPTTESEFETLESAVTAGFVTVAGDAIGTSLTADVEILSADYHQDRSQAHEFFYLPVLEIREA